MNNLKPIFALLMLFFFTFGVFAQSDNKDVSIISSGSGKSLEDAKQSALRSATEQAFGAFISSKTEMFNDQVVADQMSSVSSGNIKSFEVLNESQLPNGIWGVTLKTIVSVDKLTSFVEAKGTDIEIKGNLFALNIKQQILNEESEVKNVIELLSFIHEPLQKSFDFFLKTNNPVSVDQNNEQWQIPLDISVVSNKNYEISMNYLRKVLYSISLQKNEVEDYLNLNKKVYTVVLNYNNLVDTIYLRKEHSLKILNSLFNNFLSYIYNFKIENNISSKIDGFVFKLINDETFRDKSKLLIRNLGFPHINENEFTYGSERYKVMSNKFFTFKEYCDITNIYDSYYFHKKILNPNDHIRSLVFNILNVFDTISKFSIVDVKSLSEINKLTGYSISSNNNFSEIYNGGLVIEYEVDKKIVFPPFISFKGDWNYAKNKCEDLTLNGYSDWQLPSIQDLKIIYNFLSENNLEFILISDYSDYLILWSSDEYNDYWGERSKASFFDILTKEEFTGNCEGCPGHKSHDHYFFPIRKK